MNTIEEDMLLEERRERLLRIAGIVRQFFGTTISDVEVKRFLERGTFCPSAATEVRKREEPKRRKNP